MHDDMPLCMGESISFSGRVALAQVQRDVANAESKAFEAEKANEEDKKINGWH